MILFFTDQPNLFIDFGIRPSLHENCHHQIIYSKFDLEIFYPPPYERTVWHYQHANTDLIKRFGENFDWDRPIAHCSLNAKVSVLTNRILNIMSTFVPNDTVLINHKDPPWINSKIKRLIREKKLFYRNHTKQNNLESLWTFCQMQH